MPLDSSAELLFRISADSTPAQADMLALRAASKSTSAAILYDWAGNPIKGLSDDFVGMGEAAGTAARRTVSETTEARHAIRGLGEEIGVRMPRFVSSWLTSLGPVASVMSAAFVPIAVIGLIEVLDKIPATLQKGIDWLRGWNEEAKKAFTESLAHALKFQTGAIEIQERLRAIQLIGLEGAQKYNLELVINSKNIGDVSRKLDELRMRQAELQNLLKWKPPKQTDEQRLGGLNLTGEITGGHSNAPVGPSHEEIEKAKIQLKELEPIIDALSAKLTDLTIKGKEIPAEAAADAAKKVREGTEDFRGLSEVLEQVQAKLAGATSEEAKATQEMEKLTAATKRGQEQLESKDQKGKLAGGVFDREIAAGQEAQRLLPALYKKTLDDIAEKRRIAGEEARAKLAQMLASEQEQTLESLKAAWNARMDKEAAANQKNIKMEGDLSAEIAAVRKAGLDKIERDQAAADARAAADALRRAAQKQAEFDTEMASLTKQLEQIRASHQTAEERIAAQYAADVEKFTAAEEKKRLVAATNIFQLVQITQQYAAIRAALLVKEGTDLQALRNSPGWRGVFGAEFASMIKGNEALTKEWASSTNQSLMMVRVSMEGLKEMGQQAFGQLAQGMGQNIASAFIYKKSIGEAMRAALASTLESLAAESLTWAIYSTALGFTRLAQYDAAGAVSAFTAAAIWGSVGAAAAVAGRAIAPPQASSAAAAAAGGSVGAGSAASGPGGSDAQIGTQVPQLTIIVQGHLYGNADAVIDAINEAVLERRKTLTATNTTSGQVVRR